MALIIDWIVYNIHYIVYYVGELQLIYTLLCTIFYTKEIS